MATYRPAVQSPSQAVQEDPPLPSTPAVEQSHFARVTPETFSACFICLEAGTDKRKLYSSCSQCSAQTHKSCWYDGTHPSTSTHMHIHFHTHTCTAHSLRLRWRRKQRLSGLRARLLATNFANPLNCSICKSGEELRVGQQATLHFRLGSSSWRGRLGMGRGQRSSAATAAG